jgi:hypothetical protein
MIEVPLLDNKGDETAKQVAEQLNVLRARIQVYEAQEIPYTPEELVRLIIERTVGPLMEEHRQTFLKSTTFLKVYSSTTVSGLSNNT